MCRGSNLFTFAPFDMWDPEKVEEKVPAIR